MNHALSTSPCLGAETAAAYATHNLEVTEARNVDAHIARCGACRRKLSDLARVLTSASAASAGVTETRDTGGLLARGDGIGRYVIEEPLGAGGMGVVYAARDPQLHRRVALKMVRGAVSGEPTLQARLLREAQAMARLSHPNVVAVYDLVVVDARLYVAMEIVDGVSLKAWLRSESRTSRSILHTFVQAGRGLAAAHAAGLVHRDFKPANVLCGALGRVCVTDFGLAQSTPGSPGAGASADRTSAMPIRGPSRSGVSIRAGVVEGTPAYMAPEQHRGEPADARSDQFSFCVALHEALFKQHPFVGETAEALADAKMKGRFRPVPSKRVRVRVPSRVRKALERGMSANPTLRHASMEALLGALTTDRRPVAFGILATLAVLAVAATLTLRARHEQSERRHACTTSGSKVAAVWNDARKKAASDAFGVIPGSYAQVAWRGVNDALDRYAETWVTLRTETCEKALGDMPVASLPSDGRMVCFDERLRDLDALAAELPSIDSVGAAATAVVAAETLEPAASCSRARTTSRGTSAASAKLDEPRRAVARAKVLRYLGKSAEAAAASALVRETAESLHDDALLAQVLLEASIDDRAMRKLDTAEDEGFRAATLADAIGDDALRAKAWVALLTLQGYVRRDEKAAEHSYVQAMAAVARLADGAKLEAQVRSAHSSVLWREKKFVEARDEARRAVDIYERTEKRLELSGALDRVGIAESALGNLDAACAASARALDLATAVLGPNHPTVSGIEVNLAIFFMNAMDFARGLELAHRARMSNELAGDTSARAKTELANALLTEAQSLIVSGRQAEALPLLERALPLVDTSGASDHGLGGGVLSCFGRAYLELGQAERAMPYLERAIAVANKIPPEVLAESEFTLVKALTALRRDPERARVLATEAVAVLDGEANLGPYSSKARNEIRAWLAAAPPVPPTAHRRRSASVPR